MKQRDQPHIWNTVEAHEADDLTKRQSTHIVEEFVAEPE